MCNVGPACQLENGARCLPEAPHGRIFHSKYLKTMNIPLFQALGTFFALSACPPVSLLSLSLSHSLFLSLSLPMCVKRLSLHNDFAEPLNALYVGSRDTLRAVSLPLGNTPLRLAPRRPPSLRVTTQHPSTYRESEQVTSPSHYTP